MASAVATTGTMTISKPFYMGVYEVTQKQWENVVGKNQAHFKQIDSDYPMDQIRWVEAADFCNRLSNIADERTAGRVYRLPTEA